MVNYFGYCPSLRKKVDFEVSEVVDIPTKRGMKYQIKGTYEGRLCNTFCSAETAQELRSQIGSPQVFTVMEAEESQENLGQATQEESVPAIIGPSQKAYGQQGESAQELPLAETVPTPIIDADGIGIEPIDDLSLPDATLADMQETLDEPPIMDANFEIAEMQPEGDGSSIGNIAPMNPDAPLHAEDFESEEGMANLGQATQEESVPAIIGPSEEAYGQQGESAQELPIAETVPTPIIDADGIGIEPIDNLSSFNGGDILSQMESDLGERPDILADFAIRPIEPFGDGRSIGNITPTNPDVPFASEDDDDDDDDDDDFDAETFDPLTVEEIEVMAQVPPPVCFEEKIPPSVWENTSIQAQEEYAETGNESVLICPQCGISKADLREQGGYCGTTDPESEEYISTRSCPYEKYFSPQHWIDEPQVISHITPEKIVLEDTLTTEMDMPPIDPLPAGIETRFIPNKMFYQINQFLPKGVVSKQSLDGQSYELTYYSYDTDAVEKVIDTQAEQVGDMMFGAETYGADEEEDWEYHVYVDSDGDLAIIHNARDFETKEDAIKAAHEVSKDERGKGKEVYVIAELSEYDEDGDWIDSYEESIYKIEADGGGDETNDSNVGGITFAEWIMYNKPELYFSLLDEKNSPNMVGVGIDKARSMDFAEWMMNNKPELYFSLIDERREGFGAEEFEAEKKPSKTAEKAILTGASTGATMEIADALLAAEDEEEEFMYHVYISDYSDSVGFIDDSNRDFENQSDAKKAAEKVAKNEGKGKWVLVVAEIAEDEYEEIIYEITPDGDVYDAEDFDAETFEAGNNKRKYLGVWVHKMGDKHYYLYSDDDDDYVFGELRYNPDWKAHGWEHPYWDLDIEGGKLLFVKSFNEGVKAFRKETMNAEEFNVEFDDWADQEMLTHGKNVSFKEWAKEEGKKHGDMDLTDWAEEEEESHDERYGAEGVHHDGGRSDGGKFLSNCCDGDITTMDGKNWKCMKCNSPVEVNVEELEEWYGAEEYEITISDNNMDFGVSHKSFNDETEALEEAWKLSQKETDMFVYVRGNDGKVIRVFRPNLGRGAETFESQSAQTNVKPPVKSIGILLGLGAMAAVFAPESLKKLFNK